MAWMRWIIFRAPGNQNPRYLTVALSSECFKQALFSFDFLRFVGATPHDWLS